jgi:hypothetical protein
MALRNELERQGYSVRIDRWPARETYWSVHEENGETVVMEHPNLPADPWSMQHYLKRGFKLVKPAIPSSGKAEVLPIVKEPTPEKIECPVCARECQSMLGLSSHLRKHERESKKGE